MTDRARRKSADACASSLRLQRIANDISRDLESSNGIPIRQLDDEDSLITSIDDIRKMH